MFYISVLSFIFLPFMILILRLMGVNLRYIKHFNMFKILLLWLKIHYLFYCGCLFQFVFLFLAKRVVQLIQLLLWNRFKFETMNFTNLPKLCLITKCVLLLAFIQGCSTAGDGFLLKYLALDEGSSRSIFYDDMNLLQRYPCVARQLQLMITTDDTNTVMDVVNHNNNLSFLEDLCTNAARVPLVRFYEADLGNIPDTPCSSLMCIVNEVVDSVNATELLSQDQPDYEEPVVQTSVFKSYVDNNDN
eukprot:TRINITY_DN2371_c0_g1_i11.p2 TRINITY_DN2371_c0_g1~~TRINITY_DN2371_c0_g1_i11.p2  ORF type:complete len:246 (-),score=9.64 TRINITY_DN2371_c0_g1_i11:1168-1905(-)